MRLYSLSLVRQRNLFCANSHNEGSPPSVTVEDGLAWVTKTGAAFLQFHSGHIRWQQLCHAGAQLGGASWKWDSLRGAKAEGRKRGQSYPGSCFLWTRGSGTGSTLQPPLVLAPKCFLVKVKGQQDTATSVCKVSDDCKKFFLRRARKGIDSGRRRGRESWQKGNGNQNILYQKKFYFHQKEIQGDERWFLEAAEVVSVSV